MAGSNSVRYQFIGVIHSPFTDQKDTPIQSIFSNAQGMVEVFPPFVKGLDGLSEFSHLYLIYHFHKATPGRLEETPFLDGEKPRGIFCIRHYNRPNPIGISIVELEKVEGNCLFVKGVDVLDGTPLLDIKPYVVRFDNRENARSGWVDKKPIKNIQDMEATPGRLLDRTRDP
ncbi:MAG: S-adenosyl-L-methionine-binding protein [Methanoregulaceae archaeon PtaB.Bin108]|nr:MAG: S-adenosyl-L-methionine-binding protein [Methanoregulaceae archaeon PtaB.Bin108]OPY40407.1 MAG: S-adenosyl-L-methionine-binding protein [Methanoregulaceae archaeon PtaU1.Bin222]